MAYSTLTTYASGNVPTAAQLNQARDNLLSLRRWNSYGVHLSLTDDVSIPNTTYTAISWDKVEHQTGDMFVIGTPQRITAKVAGRYGVLVGVEWHSDTGGERTMGVEKNGGGTRFDLSSQGANTSGGGSQSGFEIVELAVNDYLRVMVYHAFGASLDIRGNGRDRTNVFMWLMGVG